MDYLQINIQQFFGVRGISKSVIRFRWGIIKGDRRSEIGVLEDIKQYVLLQSGRLGYKQWSRLDYKTWGASTHAVVARYIRIVEVSGSNPLCSTIDP